MIDSGIRFKDWIYMQAVPLNVLLLKNYPIYRQLQLEEALLRADAQNWCLINEGTSPAIVLGISGKVELLLNQELLKKNPIPVIRRFSGGGTVVVDESTCFVTFICNSQELQVPAYPDKIYQWTEKIYQALFCDLPFRLIENDYALGNKKFGGNAQYLRKERWLHHTSLLWDFDPQRMEYLLFPPKTPQYRKERGHGEFLCRLKDHHLDKAELLGNLVSVLEQRFALHMHTEVTVFKILERPHRKATLLINMDGEK